MRLPPCSHARGVVERNDGDGSRRLSGTTRIDVSRSPRRGGNADPGERNLLHGVTYHDRDRRAIMCVARNARNVRMARLRSRRAGYECAANTDVTPAVVNAITL